MAKTSIEVAWYLRAWHGLSVRDLAGWSKRSLSITREKNEWGEGAGESVIGEVTWNYFDFFLTSFLYSIVQSYVQFIPILSIHPSIYPFNHSFLHFHSFIPAFFLLFFLLISRLWFKRTQQNQKRPSWAFATYFCASFFPLPSPMRICSLCGQRG